VLTVDLVVSYVRFAPIATLLGRTDTRQTRAISGTFVQVAGSLMRRGDLFEKRRKLREAWAVYCAVPKTGKVVAFRR